MDSNFLASLLVVPPVILGVPLRPFCCGHAVLLEAIESPFLRGGEITRDELIVAAWICARTFEDGRDQLVGDREKLLKDCEAWGATVGAWDFDATSAAFQVYLSLHLKAPEKWKSKDSKSCRAPWPLTIATGMMMNLGLSESHAWNMPMQAALWYFASIAEANGDESLITEQERQRMKLAKEMAVQNGD